MIFRRLLWQQRSKAKGRGRYYAASLLSALLGFFSILQFLSNSTGIPCTMKESDYNNLVFFYHEVNSIRKPSEQATPEFAIDFWVEQWISRNLAGASVKYAKEFLTE